MSILVPTGESQLPLQWADLSNYLDSKAYRVEIYSRNSEPSVADLIFMFNYLFSEVIDDMKVYSSSWWDFCLDTWILETDSYNYGTEGKAKESIAYLKLLKESNIQLGMKAVAIAPIGQLF